MKTYVLKSQALRKHRSFRLPALLASVAALVLTAIAGFALARDSTIRGENSTAGPVPATAQATVPATRETPGVWLGDSHQLRAAIGTSETLAETLASDSSSAAAFHPGIHDVGLVTPSGEPFYLVSLLPFAEKTGAKLDAYRIGYWPDDGLTASNAKYSRPAGFIEVTPENRSTPVSKHFELADFLTHDQTAVWPKYLVLQPRLLDKLELIADALQRRGLPDQIHVMSGFRTPQYNELGVGPKGGRASHSRHMYGDAADIFVDRDRDGRMDDLDGDGKVTVQDAKVLFAIAEGVEAAHPDLVGGLSAYRATSAHGPFVHVDARGFKARW